MSGCNNVNVEPVIIGGGDGSPAYDAFGRLRVSNPLTIFDSKNIMSKNNLFDESLTGSGTVSYSSNKSTVNLNVTTASGDKVIRQSKRIMSYQPGKSLLNLNTFVMNTQTTNLEQRVGMFNDNNGIFFEDTGTGYRFVRRTYTSGSATEEYANQASWNGDTLLAGSSKSGYVLDPTLATIMFMDFEWLGMGAVRCGFVIDGKFIVAHTFLNANNLDTVYMQTANLPIRYEIETIDTIGGAAVLQQVCSTTLIEGGYSPEGRRKMIGTAALGTPSTLTTADTWYSIAAIRIKSSRPYAVIIPTGYDVSALTNDDYECGLFYGATLASGSYSYTSFDDNIEYDLTTRALSATGTRIAGNYLSGKAAPTINLSGDIPFANQLGQTIGGTSDILTLAARGKSNNNNIAGLIKWFDLT